MSAYPMVIALPNGAQAHVRIVHTVEVNGKGEQVLTQLVQSPPAYELRDGTTIELDVQIPDDLAALGWHWFGSTLMLGVMGGPCIAITTDLFPPPPYPSERGSCYDCARRFGALSAERYERAVAERVAKVTRAPKPKKDAPAAEAIQMELF